MSRPITGLALFSPSNLVDPYPTYSYLREHDPVHWDAHSGGWVITRYDDVTECLKSDGVGKAPHDSRAILERSRHLRMRRLVARAFSPQLCECQARSVSEIANELLDVSERHGSLDIQRDLAHPLPIRVMARILNVESADLPRFREWSKYLSVAMDSADCGAAYHPDMARARQDMFDYWRGRSARARGQSQLLAAMAEVQDEGERLTEEELYVNASMIFVVGTDTTANAISNAVYTLLCHPVALAHLKLSPELIENAVEELLRFDGPVQFIPRVAAEDFELSGQPVRAGQKLFVGLASAGRDPSVNPIPDTLDVYRRSIQHLAFGLGRHYCLGATLARLEIKVALYALLTRYESIVLGAGSPVRLHNFSLRGFACLPVDVS